MEHFLKDATLATSAAELWDIFVRYLESRDIHFLTYIQFAAGNIIPSQTWVKMPGFPENWGERYEAGLWEADPVRPLAALLPAPFRWRQLDTYSLSAEEKAFQAEVDRYRGNLDALIVPVFGHGNRNGYVAFGLPKSDTELSPSVMAEFRVIAQYMHQRHWELAPPEETPSVALSKREQEVLRWVARGKSNSVIADILGVSTNTVDTHLRRIYKKLDVSDRVSASLAGLSKGFITSD